MIVKRLTAIHDLGAMTVLCTDRTGTLTSAEIVLAGSFGPGGKAADRPGQFGAICARPGGDLGWLDEALGKAWPDAAKGWTRHGRLPFDYDRRMGAVLAKGPDGPLLIVKGAPEAALAVCTRVGATQILLNNLLYDLSEVGIPFDNVRAADIAKPQRWRLRDIVRFAAVMGPLSSVFDLATFAALYLLFHTGPGVFRTGWFLESIATQTLVVFLIRTRGRPWREAPMPWSKGAPSPGGTMRRDSASRAAGCSLPPAHGRP